MQIKYVMNKNTYIDMHVKVILDAYVKMKNKKKKRDKCYLSRRVSMSVNIDTILC